MMLCMEQAETLYYAMKSDSRLSNYFFPSYITCCFRIGLPKHLQNNSLGIIAISCSVPPDCNRYLDEYGVIYETALFDNHRIVYNDNIGYDDVNRFSTIDEVIEEVLRVTEEIEKNFL